jgi:hypothetical protein
MADTGVAEHVRVRLQLEAGAGGSTLDHPSEAGGREGRSPLRFNVVSGSTSHSFSGRMTDFDQVAARAPTMVSSA